MEVGCRITESSRKGGLFWHYLLRISAAKAALVYTKRFLNAKFGNSTYFSNPPGPRQDRASSEMLLRFPSVPGSPAEPPSMTGKALGAEDGAAGGHASTNLSTSPISQGGAPRLAGGFIFKCLCTHVYNTAPSGPAQPELWQNLRAPVHGSGPGTRGRSVQREPELIRNLSSPSWHDSGEGM